MGNYKKNIRDINRAKNIFIKWMKDNNAECLNYEKPEVSEEWDYYCAVDGFIGDDWYNVYFMVWDGDLSVCYNGGDYGYNNLSVSEFLELIN